MGLSLLLVLSMTACSSTRATSMVEEKEAGNTIVSRVEEPAVAIDMVVDQSVYGWVTSAAKANSDGTVTVTIMPAGGKDAQTFTTKVSYGIANAMTGASQANVIVERCAEGSFTEICLNKAGEVIDIRRILQAGLNFDTAKYGGDLTAIGSTVERRGASYTDNYNNNETGETGIFTGLSGRMVAYGWLLEKNESERTITVGDGNRATDVFNETYKVADDVKVYTVDNKVRGRNDEGDFASTRSSFQELVPSTLKAGVIYDTPDAERYQVVVVFDRDYTGYDDGSAKVVEIYEFTAHESLDVMNRAGKVTGSFVGLKPQSVRIGCDLSDPTQGSPSPSSSPYLVAANPVTVVEDKMWTIGDIEDNCPLFKGGSDRSMGKDDDGDWIVQFDTGWPRDGYQYMKNIEKVGIDPRDIDMLLVPHGHGDHYGSLFDEWEMIARSGVKQAPEVYESYEDTKGYDYLGFPEITGILKDSPVLSLITNWYPTDKWISLGNGLDMMVTLTPGHSQGCGSCLFQVTVGDGVTMKDAKLTYEKNKDGVYVRSYSDYKAGDEIFFCYMGGYGINGLADIGAGYRRTSFVSSLRYLENVFATQKTTTGKTADGIYNLAQHTNQYPYMETAYVMQEYNEQHPDTPQLFLHFMREGLDEVVNFCEKRASAIMYTDYTAKYAEKYAENGSKSPRYEYDGINIRTDITSPQIFGNTLEDIGPYKHSEGGKIVKIVDDANIQVMHGYDVFLNKGCIAADANIMTTDKETGLADQDWNIEKGFAFAKDGFVHDPDAWYVQVAVHTLDDYDGNVYSDQGANVGIRFTSGPVDSVRGNGWVEVIRTGAMTKEQATALAASLKAGSYYKVVMKKTGDLVNASDPLQTFIKATADEVRMAEAAIGK